MRATLVALLVSSLAAPLATVAADDNEKFGEAPPPPPAATVPVPDQGDDPATSSSGPQPEVTIVQRKDAKVEIRCEGGRLPGALVAHGTIVWRHGDAAGLAYTDPPLTPSESARGAAVDAHRAFDAGAPVGLAKSSSRSTRPPHGVI
jgi:hypothetical protein